MQVVLIMLTFYIDACLAYKVQDSLLNNEKYIDYSVYLALW